MTTLYFLGDRFMGQSADPPPTGTADRPLSQVWVCPGCGRAWATRVVLNWDRPRNTLDQLGHPISDPDRWEYGTWFPRQARPFIPLSRPCATCPQRSPEDPPGSLWLSWYPEANALLPEELMRREVRLHLEHYNLLEN